MSQPLSGDSLQKISELANTLFNSFWNLIVTGSLVELLGALVGISIIFFLFLHFFDTLWKFLQNFIKQLATLIFVLLLIVFGGALIDLIFFNKEGKRECSFYIDEMFTECNSSNTSNNANKK